MLSMKQVFFSLLLVSLAAISTQAQHNSDEAEQPWDQWAESNPSWVAEATPHQVIGNIYYVGSRGLSSYLITSSQGHILLDGGLPQNAQMIASSIAALDFELADVKVLINSHAHFDHSGGLAELKELSGARLVSSEGDRSALETGTYEGSEDNHNYSAPPVQVDEIIEDGGVITLGNTQLTAHVTPGHSRGCTSWSMAVTHAEKKLDVLFFCGATVAANSLAPEQYPGIVEAYRETFSKTRGWQPDVPLTNHPDFFFDQANKAKAKLAGDALAYVDRDRFQLGVQAQETRFVKSLAEQRKYSQLVKQYSFSQQATDKNTANKDARYVFYQHGKIIEDQGLAAVSSQFGEYQYLDILSTLRDQGHVVISEPRQQNAEIQGTVDLLTMQVNALLDSGVPAKNISLVGASKGAFIVSAVANNLKNRQLKTVLLAGCSEGAVAHMQQQKMKLYGAVLTIRDSSDTRAAGSCQPIADASPGIAEFKELVVETSLSHGLIYRPLPAWINPLREWIGR